jgi:DNA-binding LacI/PurR family transcriptional regulator
VKRRVTIKDVAKEAGVSHPTVSRVLHGKKHVSAHTRALVEDALERLGYEPNLLARGLVTQKSQTVALITPPLAPYTHQIVGSVGDECRARGYGVLLCPSHTWEQENLALKWVEQNWRVDGIIVYSLLHHEKVTDDVLDLASSGVPLVFVNKFLGEDRLNSVGVDSKQAVFLAIEHLASLGHRRIGIINGHRGSEDGASRYEAFQAALQRLGLEFDESLVREGVWEEPLGREGMKDILSSANPSPTAVFCANDSMALGAIRAIEENGLKVPDDISVVGFDDLEVGRYFTPPLTTVHPPLREVGMYAVDLLVKLISNPKRRRTQAVLKSKLVVRATTARPRNG